MDPFEDMGNNQSSSSGLEGIIFDDNQYNKPQPQKKSEDDIFGGGMQAPESIGTKPTNSNPFDAFGTTESKPVQQKDPFSSDIFSQNIDFPNTAGQQQNMGFGFGQEQHTGFGQAQNTGFGNNQNTGFGMGQSDWGSGFTSQFSGSGFQTDNAFSTPNTFSSQPVTKNERKSDFAALNPFGGNPSGQQANQNNTKPAGAPLPPGVSGFDLFQ